MKEISKVISEAICSYPWYIEISLFLLIITLVIYFYIENYNTTKEDYFSQNEIDLSARMVFASVAAVLNSNIFFYVTNRTIAIITIVMISIIFIIFIINIKKLPIWEEK